ncbi:hypothetical protein [Streptomyces zaehneri]|uniref:hypothetical protein n=1 Tax=Streptomyces zaehneri TaxID=3051180 RepID=UPI0028D5ED9A|nr:hypothetical protein [Streptomyces sp. DSM 40713]
MAAQEMGGNGIGEPGGEPSTWDFRLDRAGLVVKAGRHLQLHVSLALLLWLIAAVAGMGAFHWELPPAP